VSAQPPGPQIKCKHIKSTSQEKNSRPVKQSGNATNSWVVSIKNKVFSQNDKHPLNRYYTPFHPKNQGFLYTLEGSKILLKKP